MTGRICRLVPLIGLAAALAPAAQRGCVGAVPVGTFRVRVRPAAGGDPLPLRRVNTLPQGARLIFDPLQLPGDLKKSAKVAVVVAPAGKSGGGVTVLDLKGVDTSSEWTMPFNAGVILLIFGPQGLDDKRVENLVSSDSDLVGELAGYADQTEDLQDTIDTLTLAEEQQQDTDEDLIRASRTTPTEQALFTLVRALNPSATTYNPLAGGKRTGPQGTMTKATSMFFENAGGTFPGSGALPFMKSYLFPDTEFKTVYAQTTEAGDLVFCSQRQLARSRNRFAYVWGFRVINAGPPQVSLAQPGAAVAQARCLVPLRVKTAQDWQYVERLRDWTLTPAGGTAISVPVHSGLRALDLDLRNPKLGPATYRLAARWDWSTVDLGELRIAPGGDPTAARLTADSQARLIEASGPVTVSLEGTDFEFVEKATLRCAGRFTANPQELDFGLPAGRRAGPQPRLDLDIDTSHLRAGDYLVALSQTGGSTRDVPIRVLPVPPRIDNLPLRVHPGEPLTTALEGIGLERIESISAGGASFEMLPGGGRFERFVKVTLAPGAKTGELLAMNLKLAGVASFVPMQNAVRAGAPKPVLTSAKGTLPDDLQVALAEGELPAGSFAGFAIETDQPAANVLYLECSEKAKTFDPIRVHAGERRREAKLESVSDGKLFAAFDPGAVGQPGCTVIASVESEEGGRSAPVTLGRVVRVPRIEALVLSNDKTADGSYTAVLRGRDLESIDKAGWTADSGLPVQGPPRTVAAEGDRQVLRISLPWPSPMPVSPLYVWLRGDQKGRLVTLKP